MNRRGIRGNRRAGRTVSAAFTPASLSGLVQWLDATNGASASAWTDLSGAGHHCSQPVGGQQPTVVAGALNGKAVVRFAGGQNMPSGAWAIGTTGATIFQVFNIATIGTNIPMAKAFAGTDWEFAGEGAGILRWAVSSGAGTKATSNASLDGAAHVVCGVYDGSLSPGQTTFMYVDGTLQTTTGTFAGPIANGADQVNVGSYCNAVNAIVAGITGDVAEVIIVNRAITAGERAQVQAYLKTKWGTP